MPRKALGRGLSSLLREVETTVAAGLEQVPVGAIDPNPFQPRRAFPEESLSELADSIRASGMVQPVLLRRTEAVEGRFQLIAGERRWRAARQAGLESVPAVVRELGDREALELALTENLLREELNPLEVARAYQTLQQNFGLSHEEIAGHLGVNRSTVTNTLRLLRLPASVQEFVADGRLSAGHARALAGLEDVKTITQLARQIVEKGLSVRQAEELVAGITAQPASRAVKPAAKIDPNMRAAVLELERTLGTKVRIVGNSVRGRIEIKYFSAEDLNRLYEWIVRH
jgi:ParB family transcriptional regulator, chromosome partitioning protein